MFVYKARKDK